MELDSEMAGVLVVTVCIAHPVDEFKSNKIHPQFNNLIFIHIKYFYS